ncbi:metal-dependent hydrolase [Bacillus dakarensis]|uniref:metal-dependent hydrolase n=1 Tax=Robertmurraya dakarensis TaxID=1926278 RepID=UPI000981B59A|nr:metal-dependent hydrolase [Bacillus dakarensis]
MKGRTHLAVGLGIGIIASVRSSPEDIPVILAAAGVASLAPDLDGRNLLNRRVTKTAKKIKKSGVYIAAVLMLLALLSFFFDFSILPFVDKNWFGLQNKLLLFAWGVVILGFSVRSQETLKNILMSIIGLFLMYYAANNEFWWLVMFALYIGVAGWFAHRGTTHTLWALVYWWYMSFLMENSTAVNGLAVVSTLAYLSHIVGDMMTVKGVKFLFPLTKKSFRFLR